MDKSYHPMVTSFGSPASLGNLGQGYTNPSFLYGTLQKPKKVKVVKKKKTSKK